MAIVIDASVAMKWVLEEVGSDLARALAAVEMMVAPEFLLVECANVLWRQARRKQISKDEAIAAFAALEAMPIRLVPIRPYVAAAQAIACEVGQTVYDSLYLAIALADRSVLVTADKAFCHAATAHPVYRASVRLLGA